MQAIKNYFTFLGHQLTGWPVQNYMLFAFSFGLQLMLLVSNPITTVALVAFAGTTIGVLCILAINAAKSVNGWLGLVSAVCFIYIGFEAKNYLAMGEQITYILALDIPVLLSASWNSNMAAKIRQFTAKTWVIALAATVAVYFVSGWVMVSFTDDAMPWVDALPFAISLTASVICFLRYNNQYIWWLASGLTQVVLWYLSFRTGHATIAMFVNSSVYLLNDVLAFTISPWYNKKNRAELVEKEEAYLKQKSELA